MRWPTASDACVNLAGLAWSTVSRHLATLKKAGVLSDEKRGQHVYYRLRLCCVADFNRCLSEVTPGLSAPQNVSRLPGTANSSCKRST
jgi:DNA-binding transcriptional ArsR family regulator